MKFRVPLVFFQCTLKVLSLKIISVDLMGVEERTAFNVSFEAQTVKVSLGEGFRECGK